MSYVQDVSVAWIAQDVRHCWVWCLLKVFFRYCLLCPCMKGCDKDTVLSLWLDFQRHCLLSQSRIGRHLRTLAWPPLSPLIHWILVVQSGEPLDLGSFHNLVWVVLSSDCSFCLTLWQNGLLDSIIGTSSLLSASCLQSCWQVHLSCCHCRCNIPSVMLEASSSGFQCRPKTSSSLGTTKASRVTGTAEMPNLVQWTTTKFSTS